MRKSHVFWLRSLVLVAVLASVVTYAQMRRSDEPVRILSGADVGVRIVGTSLEGDPIGSLVVRIDGEWVEVATGYPMPRPISPKPKPAVK